MSMQQEPSTVRLKSSLSFGNQLFRLLWHAVWLSLFRPSPRVCHGWRRALLRMFGAHVGKGALIYPSVRIWAPWNLDMADISVLGPEVDCYCVEKITIGRHAVVSQYSYLCTATHDFENPAFPMIARPIRIEDEAWICADVFVGPGVTVGQGAVVGARASVFKSIEPWTVVGGSPARYIKHRQIADP